MLGSLAVVAAHRPGRLHSLLRRGLRPIEAMAGRPTGSPPATSPSGRPAPARAARSGQLGRRPERHAGPDRGRCAASARPASSRCAQLLRRRQPRAAHPAGLAARQCRAVPAGRPRSTSDVDEVMERIVLETRRASAASSMTCCGLARLGQQPDRDQEPVDVTAADRPVRPAARIADPGRCLAGAGRQRPGRVGDEELMRRPWITSSRTCSSIPRPPPPAALTASAAGGTGPHRGQRRRPGVAPGQLPHLFERFYRPNPAGCPGSGLGLAIAAEIASAHGGTAHAARRAARPADHARPPRAAAASPAGPAGPPDGISHRLSRGRCPDPARQHNVVDHERLRVLAASGRAPGDPGGPGQLAPVTAVKAAPSRASSSSKVSRRARNAPPGRRGRLAVGIADAQIGRGARRPARGIPAGTAAARRCTGPARRGRPVRRAW